MFEAAELPHKGRVLVANDEIKAGQVIFVESPFAVIDPRADFPAALEEHCRRCVSQVKPEHFAALLVYWRSPPAQRKRWKALYCPDFDRADAQMLADVRAGVDLLLAERGGEEHDRDECVRMCLRAAGNGFAGEEDGVSLLFSKASLLSHDCNPSCCWITDANRYTLRATRTLQPGDELTISYIVADLVKPTHTRRRVLLERSFFFCSCDRCSAPDTARGFLCPAEGCGGAVLLTARNTTALNPDAAETDASPCSACGAVASPDQIAALIDREGRLEARVSVLSETSDPAELSAAHAECRAVFASHWIKHRLDDMLCDLCKEMDEFRSAVLLGRASLAHLEALFPPTNGANIFVAHALIALGDSVFGSIVQPDEGTGCVPVFGAAELDAVLGDAGRPKQLIELYDAAMQQFLLLFGEDDDDYKQAEQRLFGAMISLGKKR